jgi:hypothetical protein
VNACRCCCARTTCRLVYRLPVSVGHGPSEPSATPGDPRGRLVLPRACVER